MKKKYRILSFAIVGVILLALLSTVILKDRQMVRVYMEGKDGKIGENVLIDFKVSAIPDEYQASSFVIEFDNQKLKFKGIQQGNVATVGEGTEDMRYPEWQYDADSANASGTINTMYLDMTAGEQPLSHKGFEEGKQDVLFRMEFQILTTCASNEKLDLTISQGTFASVDEDLSLSLKKKNMKAESYQIKVIE